MLKQLDIHTHTDMNLDTDLTAFMEMNSKWIMGEGIRLQWWRPGFYPWVGKIPWRRAWQPIPIFLPGESHGQSSLAGYSESDTMERLTTRKL